MSTNSNQVLGYAPYGQLDQITVKPHTQSDLGMAVGPSGGAVQRLTGVGKELFLNTSAPYSITVYDPTTDKITLVGDSNGRIQAENPAPTQGGVVALDATSTRGLYFIASDGTFSRVYAPLSGWATFDVASDESQGFPFVWLQGQSTGLDYVNMAIWSEPYTTTLSGSVPKRITGIDTTFNYGGGMAVNAGMALLLTSATTAELVRLSDGWAWSITAEPGDRWAKPIWVNTTEVWLAVASAQTTLEDGVVKFQLSALGPPTIAPK